MKKTLILLGIISIIIFFCIIFIPSLYNVHNVKTKEISMMMEQRPLEYSHNLPKKIISNKAYDNYMNQLYDVNIVFTTPNSLKIDTYIPIHLLLSKNKTIKELEKRLFQITKNATISKTGERIKASPYMEATLTGINFEIKPITNTKQLIDDDETKWTWEVKALKGGTQRLYLSISALINVRGYDKPKVIKTYDREIVIKVSTKYRISKFIDTYKVELFSGLFIPFIIFIIKYGYTKYKKRCVKKMYLDK